MNVQLRSGDPKGHRHTADRRRLHRRYLHEAALLLCLGRGIDLPLPLVVGRDVDPVLLTPLPHTQPTAPSPGHDLCPLCQLRLLVVHLQSTVHENTSVYMAVHGTAIYCTILHGGIVSCYVIVCKSGLGFTLTDNLPEECRKKI